MSASAVARRRRRRRSNGPSGNGRNGGSTRNRGLVIVGGLLVLLVVLAGVAAAGGAIYGRAQYDDFVSGVVPPEELLSNLPRGGARVYDRHGVLLYEFVDELSGLRRPVPLTEISEWLVQATVSTEDASFWENNGLNWRGLARAAYENVSPLGGAVFEGSGGSSLTQQLAKNVYIPREERAERSVERKLKEAAIALELTQLYSKEQILEWYMNSISYGSIYVGVEAAAQGYFGKSAGELSLAESALLAGIPQQPALYDPFLNLDSEGRLTGAAKARQRQVLGLMARQGYITAEQMDDAIAEEIAFKTGRFQIEAAHFVLGRVASEIKERFGSRALFDDGLEVTTSLDLELQHQAGDILEGWVTEFEVQSDGHNSAMIAIDPRTGQILVYIGSRDYFRDDIEGRNDNIISLNSPGSSLKPFTYMTAFMQGWSTSTGIIDAPFQIMDPATGEPYSPRNFNIGECVISSDCRYQGVIRADLALGNSLNTPALKTIIAAGVGNVVSLLKEVGFTTLDNPLGYGPALTLGGVDITLEDIVYAYSVLANEGVMRGQEVTVPFDPGERTIEPVVLLKVTDADGQVLYEFTAPAERRVVASNFIYLVTSILSNGNNQCLTFGACGALGLPGRPSAVKTGTSEPFEDSRQIGDTWAVGYTPELVAGVWAGNSDNAPMVNIVSTSISWRSWRDFMVFAHEHLSLPPTRFQRPPGVVERELCWPSGRAPSDLCPRINRYTGLFAEDALPRNEEQLAEMQDSWWQLVGIDTRTGLLATSSTPSAFVSEEVRLVLPREEIYLFDRRGEEIEVWDGLFEWAVRYGITNLLAPHRRELYHRRTGAGDGAGGGSDGPRQPHHRRPRVVARVPALRRGVGPRDVADYLGAHPHIRHGGYQRHPCLLGHSHRAQRRLHRARRCRRRGTRRAAVRRTGRRRQRRRGRGGRPGALGPDHRAAERQRPVWHGQHHRQRALRRDGRSHARGGSGAQPDRVDAHRAHHDPDLRQAACPVGHDGGARRCLHIAPHRSRPETGQHRAPRNRHGEKPVGRVASERARGGGRRW